MRFISNIVNRNKLIFLSLFLLFSCRTTEESVSLSFVFDKDEQKGDEEELGIKRRDYLLGLQDNESFFFFK